MEGRASLSASRRSVVADGLERTYLLHRPAALRQPAPLVLVLHGGFGQGYQARRDYGWDRVADAAGFLVAYPDGVGRSWNAGGGCCGPAARRGIDDAGFILAVLASLDAEMAIDRRRVYATGMSNGGILAYHLACRTSEVFAAIGPVAATQLGPCRSPAPTSVMHIHGTADSRVPYLGGRGLASAAVDGPPIPALHAAWAELDRCGPAVVRVAGNVTTSEASAADGRGVTLVTIAGAGHQWPGALGHPVAERMLTLDPPSRELDATATLWRFFEAHPLPR